MPCGALRLVAMGVMLVSIVTGFLTGRGLWSLANAVVAFVVAWLHLLLVADQ